MKALLGACAQMGVCAFAGVPSCELRASIHQLSSFTRTQTCGLSQRNSFAQPVGATPQMCESGWPPKIHEEPVSRKHSRRGVLSVGAAAAAALVAGRMNAAVATDGSAVPAGATDIDGGLAQYRGPLSLRYEFSYPRDGWDVTKKPIKTHLAEVVVVNTSGRSSTAAGVTVDAVKIAKIEDFGSPDEVGAKVVAIENKKDNVLSAALVSAGQSSADGLTYFSIEYTVETGRGLKRYLAKATITGGNLYVFTAQAKVADFDGIDGPVLASMVQSFHVTPQYA